MTALEALNKILRTLYYTFHPKHLFLSVRRRVLRKTKTLFHGELPSSLFIEVTGVCNLRCVICHRSHIREELGEMDLGTFARVARIFPYVESVCLMGIGEPLASKNILEMIAVCKSYGLSVGFNSNGVLLTPSLTKDLILSGLDTFVFSIDGATKEVYEKIRIGSNFDKVIENIKTFTEMKKELNRNNPILGLEFVAITKNIHELLPYIDLAKKIGINKIVVSHVITFSEDQEKEALYNHSDPRHQQIWNEAISKARDLGIRLILPPSQAVENSNCRFRPWKCLFVSWKGDVKPCCTYLHSLPLLYKGKKIIVPTMNFGNVHKEDILNLWYSPEYIKFREQILNKKYTEICDCCLYSKELIPA